MTATDTSADVNARLDHLSAQVDLIAEELRLQRESREKWSDLVETLQPVTSGAMGMATVQFQELSEDVSIDDATEFLKTLARSLPQLNALMAQLDSLSQLAELVSSLSGPAMAKATDFLEVADEKGYFAFARQGGEIADQIVTEFDEDDVKALGDNVVTILNAVKELTQPEIMSMLQRTAVTIQEGEDTPTEPPSMFALIKSMREPQTRRGLGRVLNMLKTVGEEHLPAPAGTAMTITQPTNPAQPK
ncbi:MAG: DUF1641 domain-containing protein [Candidatus Nanopelagicales bacterium]